MEVSLNKQQMDFLGEKFGIKKEDVENMDFMEWRSIREKCFEIETDELLDFEKSGKDCDYCNTQDYLIASSIIDLPYKM